MSKLLFTDLESRSSGSSQAQKISSQLPSSTRKRPLEQVDVQMSFDKSGSLAELINKSLEAAASTGWAPELLQECARAVIDNEGPRTQYLMWLLNEMSSPYGDVEQRLAAAFLQSLFARLTRTGSHYYHSICTAAARAQSFESQKKMVLKFQELSPWMTVGIIGANGAILEALAGEKKVHIVDISNNFCTQWPTLFEALAMRAEHPPHLRLTTISVSKEETSHQQVMKEISHRLEKFARLMGVPFEFRVVEQASIETLEPSMLDIREGEALIVNSFQALQQTPESNADQDHLLRLITGIKPKTVIVVEDEVNLTSSHFMTCFREAVRFYSIFFDALDNSFPRTSNERLMLERVAARKIVGVLACDGSGSTDSQRLGQWKVRMEKNGGFVTKPLRDEVVDDIQALLKRYKPGWGLCKGEVGLFLTWKDQNAISVSVWKLHSKHEV